MPDDAAGRHEVRQGLARRLREARAPGPSPSRIAKRSKFRAERDDWTDLLTRACRRRKVQRLDGECHKAHDTTSKNTATCVAGATPAAFLPQDTSFAPLSSASATCGGGEEYGYGTA